MKKIVSNILVVTTQLVIGGLFLFMLFSNTEGDNKVVAVNNNNLDKMADAVTLLFDAEETPEVNILDEEAKKREEELITAEQKKAEEEAARKKAEEEAAEKARKEAEEAARKKAEEEEAARQRAAAAISSNQTVASLQEYAHGLVINTYGWSEDDFVALVNLWNKESGWDVHCYNSYSGATGIPQALPGSKMASEGDDWATNGETQIRWGLKYIQERYGSPLSAWNHFLNTNWY